MLGPGEEGQLPGRALQNIFFKKPLPSKTGDVADFPNTEKQAERLRQNEKTEEFVPNEKNRTKPQPEI